MADDGKLVKQDEDYTSQVDDALPVANALAVVWIRKHTRLCRHIVILINGRFMIVERRIERGNRASPAPGEES